METVAQSAVRRSVFQPVNIKVARYGSHDLFRSVMVIGRDFVAHLTQALYGFKRVAFHGQYR